ncbi:hypothetical protein FWB53_08180 [Campylobacter jejuni]|nr:hypothetical protein [Campylobacter jejuni]EDP6005421.1 hypothetical protein [Campylobacter jejuni]HBK6297569.1 hypothetical protein [Campylobacter jejuni]
MKSSNLWILTEERPKRDVLFNIIKKFADDNGISFFVEQNLFIVPVLNINGDFSFGYKILGVHSAVIKNVFLFVVSGNSSFMDFLIFYQDNIPNPLQDIPLYAIEETKTSDYESRNTGVFQRASKFVFIDLYYKDIKKIMLYSIRIGQDKNPTLTNKFGSKCLATLGVQILGKSLDDCAISPFDSIDDLINFKNTMRQPSRGNIPIKISKSENKITISGRLEKDGSLSHDPNIGALSLISATLRALGYVGKIEITSHNLSQNQIGRGNKFISIANLLGISLENIDLPAIQNNDSYWHYEMQGEKIATIFLHLVIEEFTRARAIYENHAGCERGYFITQDNKNLTVEKYKNKDEYKNGNKNARIFIPDLVLADFDRKQIINIEGKKFIKVQCGIDELENYDAFENLYIKKHYEDYEIIRTVVLFGGEIDEISNLGFPKINFNDIPKIGFVLTKNGKTILQIHSPKIFGEAIFHLRAYYGLNKSG